MHRGRIASERPLRIAVLAYDGCLAAELFGFADVLLIANRVAARGGSAGPLFTVSVVGCGGARSIAAAGGARIGVQRWRGRYDLLVVPGFDFERSAALDGWLRARRPEVSMIDAAFRKGVPVTAVCVGAFLLGEAGLLDERRVTTAWAFARDLERRYPAARVEATSFLVEDGGVTTTAAFTAATDLAMHLVRRHGGEAVGRATGSLLLIAGPRESQAPYVDQAVLRASEAVGSFSDGVRQWLLGRLRQRYDLAALARAFHVSTRTLLRRFKSETGQSPLDFLRAARVERAKGLLESTTLGSAEIMDRVGYADLSTFRRLFIAAVRMSPASYRRQFRRAPVKPGSPPPRRR